MRIKHILSIVAITLTPYSSSLLAQESATVGQKSTQEKRTQKETAINDEASMELQRQKGAEQRDGKETRNSTSTSVRDSDETSSRQQNQTTNRLAVKTAPLAILNELFTYIEKGRSTRGRTANLIKHCALVTKPKAPQFPDLEPKPLVTSVQACMAWNKEKTLGQCQVELHQANFNWATTGVSIPEKSPIHFQRSSSILICILRRSLCAKPDLLNIRLSPF